jgi:hypothetical protein
MEFGILGPLSGWDAGREVSLGGPKPRALLAALLLHANEVLPSRRGPGRRSGCPDRSPERPRRVPARAVQLLVDCPDAWGGSRRSVRTKLRCARSSSLDLGDGCARRSCTARAMSALKKYPMPT